MGPRAKPQSKQYALRARTTQFIPPNTTTDHTRPTLRLHRLGFIAFFGLDDRESLWVSSPLNFRVARYPIFLRHHYQRRPGERKLARLLVDNVYLARVLARLQVR